MPRVWSPEFRHPSGTSAWLSNDADGTLECKADFCIQVVDVLRKQDKSFFFGAVNFKQFIKGSYTLSFANVDPKSPTGTADEVHDLAKLCRDSNPGGGLDGDLQEDPVPGKGTGWMRPKIGRPSSPDDAAHGYFDRHTNQYLFYDAPGNSTAKVGEPDPNNVLRKITKVTFDIEITHYLSTPASAGCSSQDAGLWRGRFKLQGVRTKGHPAEPDRDGLTFTWITAQMLDGAWTIARA